MDRRDFLKRATLASGAAAWTQFRSPVTAAQNGDDSTGHAAQERRGDILYRELGRTGERVSAIGLGGYHIGGQKDEQESIRIIRGAVDRGITFMDNCWDYHGGESERRMGKALQDGYREKVLLMSKIDGRTKASAARQIDESLQRLRTDHIDLMQHHEVIRLEGPDRIFDEGGAQEAMIAARKAGKIRYIGFTGHKDPYVHLRMLDIADRNGFRFDAVQMPLNVLDASFRSFQKQVLPRLVRDRIGVLGMKPLASGALPKLGGLTAEECLCYALSLPADVVITGIDSMDILEQALRVAKQFEPLSTQQKLALESRHRDEAATGDHEGFKTSARFDSTAHHPEWLG